VVTTLSDVPLSPDAHAANTRASAADRRIGFAERGRIMIGLGVEDTRWTRGTLKTLRRAATRWSALAALVMLVACGDSATGPKPPSANDPAAGTFALTTVNAQPLPFTLFNEAGFRLVFAGSTLALQADGQFVLAESTVETVAGFASTYADTVRGTWTQNVGTIAMRATDGAATNATWDGRQIVLDLVSEGQQLRSIYRKNP
jgi:hypothetical protein